jgi:hypothetical protein
LTSIYWARKPSTFRDLQKHRSALLKLMPRFELMPLLIMGDKHSVPKTVADADPADRARLKQFIDYAKRFDAGSSVHRVYAQFNSIQAFASECRNG